MRPPKITSGQWDTCRVVQNLGFFSKSKLKTLQQMFHQTFTLGVFFVAVAHLIIDESSNTDSIRFVKMFNSQTALAALVWCCTPKIRAGSMTCYGPTLPSEKKEPTDLLGFCCALPGQSLEWKKPLWLLSFWKKMKCMYPCLSKINFCVHTKR